jgi:hypothetical protein
MKDDEKVGDDGYTDEERKWVESRMDSTLMEIEEREQLEKELTQDILLGLLMLVGLVVVGYIIYAFISG